MAGEGRWLAPTRPSADSQSASGPPSPASRKVAEVTSRPWAGATRVMANGWVGSRWWRQKATSRSAPSRRSRRSRLDVGGALARLGSGFGQRRRAWRCHMVRRSRAAPAQRRGRRRRFGCVWRSRGVVALVLQTRFLEPGREGCAAGLRPCVRAHAPGRGAAATSVVGLEERLRHSCAEIVRRVLLLVAGKPRQDLGVGRRAGIFRRRGRGWHSAVSIAARSAPASSVRRCDQPKRRQRVCGLQQRFQGRFERSANPTTSSSSRRLMPRARERPPSAPSSQRRSSAPSTPESSAEKALSAASNTWWPSSKT